MYNRESGGYRMDDATPERREGLMASQGPLLTALAIYAPCAAALVLLSRHQLNVDGVAYLRIARYYAAGNLDLAVTGYWAPLLSWLLVPGQLLGLDLRLASKGLNAVAGVLFITAVDDLARLLELNRPLRWAVTVGCGWLYLTWLPVTITPDLLVSTILMLYLGQSYRMSRRLHVRNAVGAGVLAGFAYLAKYYALPFFLVHHSVAAMLLPRRDGVHGTGRRRLICWLTGTIACLVVAAPWIAVLSSRYGCPTFSTTGKVAHSLAGPESPPGDRRPSVLLAQPRAGRITSWENPDEIRHVWPAWSPFTSVDGILHQLRLFLRNGREVAKWVFAADGLGLLYIALMGMPLLACMPRENVLRVDSWAWRWSLAFVVAYLSGFMFVFAGSRRYYWPMEGLLLAMAGLGAQSLSSAMASAPQGVSRLRSPTFWVRVFSALILLACGLPCLDTAREVMTRPGLELKRIAERLKTLPVDGPLVSNRWNHAVCIAYYLDRPCLGVPRPGRVEEVMLGFKKAGAGTLLMFKQDDYPRDAKWLTDLMRELGPPVEVITVGEHEVWVYDLTMR